MCLNWQHRSKCLATPISHLSQLLTLAILSGLTFPVRSAGALICICPDDAIFPHSITFSSFVKVPAIICIFFHCLFFVIFKDFFVYPRFAFFSYVLSIGTVYQTMPSAFPRRAGCVDGVLLCSSIAPGLYLTWTEEMTVIKDSTDIRRHIQKRWGPVAWALDSCSTPYAHRVHYVQLNREAGLLGVRVIIYGWTGRQVQSLPVGGGSTGEQPPGWQDLEGESYARHFLHTLSTVAFRHKEGFDILMGLRPAAPVMAVPKSKDTHSLRVQCLPFFFPLIYFVLFFYFILWSC